MVDKEILKGIRRLLQEYAEETPGECAWNLTIIKTGYKYIHIYNSQLNKTFKVPLVVFYMGRIIGVKSAAIKVFNLCL